MVPIVHLLNGTSVVSRSNRVTNIWVDDGKIGENAFFSFKNGLLVTRFSNFASAKLAAPVLGTCPTPAAFQNRDFEQLLG